MVIGVTMFQTAWYYLIQIENNELLLAPIYDSALLACALLSDGAKLPPHKRPIVYRNFRLLDFIRQFRVPIDKIVVKSSAYSGVE